MDAFFGSLDEVNTDMQPVEKPVTSCCDES